MIRCFFHYSIGLIIAIVLGVYKNNLEDMTIYLIFAFVFGYIAIYKAMLNIFEKSFLEFLYEFRYSYLTGVFLILVNSLLQKILINNVVLSLIIKSGINIIITSLIMKFIY